MDQGGWANRRFAADSTCTRPTPARGSLGSSEARRLRFRAAPVSAHCSQSSALLCLRRQTRRVYLSLLTSWAPYRGPTIAGVRQTRDRGQGPLSDRGPPLWGRRHRL